MSNNRSARFPSPDDPERVAYCQHTEYEHNGTATDLPATGETARGLERRVWDALYDVEDPEMPISIVDLGLIYGVEIRDGHTIVEMTLTYTGCPARNMLLRDVQSAVQGVDAIESCDVHLVWSPEWSIDFITEDGANALREFGVSVP